MYGDNAYDSEKNRRFSKEKNITPLFHTKEETGKTPKKKRSAKNKSKNRSRIEALFGISRENMGFGKVLVRGLWRVAIDVSLTFIVWNFGSLYAFFVNRFEDRISLRKLLYNNK
jgi:IS5 family transposase